MQTSKRQLQQLQMIMMALGYYSGKIDGIWSAKSIEAKKAWEYSGKFNPAYPNNGLPFADTDVVPAGMRFDRATRLFTHRSLTDTMIAQYLGNKVETPVQQPSASTIPEGAEKLVEVKDVTVEEPKQETAEKPAHQQHQHNKHQHKHNR